MEKRKLHLRYLSVWVLATASVLVNFSSAQASATNTAKRGIQAALTARTQARQRRDLNAYMATFTPDWITVNVAGRVVNFNTLRQSMAVNFFRAPSTGAIHSEITRLTATGDTAEVTMSTHFNFPAQKAASGLVYPYKDTVASEMWVKGPAGWQEKRERYLVDTGGISAKPLSNSERRMPKL